MDSFEYLMKTIRRGDSATISHIIEKHPEAALHSHCASHEYDGRFCGTALMFAANQGRAKCVAALIDASDPLAMSQDGCGNNALMNAAKEGHADCVQLPFPVSDPAALDTHRWDALMMASTRGHEACVLALLRKSDAWAANVHGTSALMLAALNGHTSCFRALLASSNPNQTDKKGWTVLMRAASESHLAAVEMLLADPRVISDRDPRLPSSRRAIREALAKAEQFGHVDCAGLLRASLEREILETTLNRFATVSNIADQADSSRSRAPRL